MMSQVAPVYFLLPSIFGDEPTGALNSKATEDVLSIFQDIHEEGKTILIVTYDAKVAAMSERVYT